MRRTLAPALAALALLGASPASAEPLDFESREARRSGPGGVRRIGTELGLDPSSYDADLLARDARVRFAVLSTETALALSSALLQPASTTGHSGLRLRPRDLARRGAPRRPRERDVPVLARVHAALALADALPRAARALPAVVPRPQGAPLQLRARRPDDVPVAVLALRRAARGQMGDQRGLRRAPGRRRARRVHGALRPPGLEPRHASISISSSRSAGA